MRFDREIDGHADTGAQLYSLGFCSWLRSSSGEGTSVEPSSDPQLGQHAEFQPRAEPFGLGRAHVPLLEWRLGGSQLNSDESRGPPQRKLQKRLAEGQPPEQHGHPN